MVRAGHWALVPFPSPVHHVSQAVTVPSLSDPVRKNEKELARSLAEAGSPASH